MKFNKLGFSRRSFIVNGGVLAAGGLLGNSLLSKAVFADDLPFNQTIIAKAVGLGLYKSIISPDLKIPIGVGQKVIGLDKVSESLLGGISNLQAPVTGIINGQPLLGLAQMGEMVILKIIPLLGSVAGPIGGLILSSLFGYLNNLLTKPGPSLISEITRIAGELIDDNNFKTMSLSVKGITDVHADFISHLDTYLKDGASPDSRGQVLRKFDALISIGILNLPKLLTLSKGIGLPLYMQTTTLMIIAFHEVLSRKKELNLDDEYLKTNTATLAANIDKWLKNSQDAILETFKVKSDNYNLASEYLRNMYTSGYAMLLGACKSSPGYKIGVKLQIRNTAELYSSTSAYMSWDKMKNIVNKNDEILARKSLLTRLQMVGHKNNVLRIAQDYIDGSGKVVVDEGESCSEPMNNSNAYLVDNDFEINPFVNTDIDGSKLPNTYTVNAPGLATYLLELNSPSGLIRAGEGNTQGLYTLNLPGYYFSGFCFSIRSKGKTCQEDAGFGLTTYCGIFRHYDGIEIRKEFSVDEASGRLQENVSYEFDLNGGCIDVGKQTSAMSDLFIGKNIVYPTGNNALKISFTVFITEGTFIAEGTVFKCLLLAEVKLSSEDNPIVVEIKKGDTVIANTASPLTEVTVHYGITSFSGRKFNLVEFDVKFSQSITVGKSLEIDLTLTRQDVEQSFASLTIIPQNCT